MCTQAASGSLLRAPGRWKGNPPLRAESLQERGAGPQPPLGFAAARQQETIHQTGLGADACVASHSPPEGPRGWPAIPARGTAAWPATPRSLALEQPLLGCGPSAAKYVSLPTWSSIV